MLGAVFAASQTATMAVSQSIPTSESSAECAVDSDATAVASSSARMVSAAVSTVEAISQYHAAVQRSPYSAQSQTATVHTHAAILRIGNVRENSNTGYVCSVRLLRSSRERARTTIVASRARGVHVAPESSADRPS
mmetsp:Transcript_35870/g.110520  ORF Transcript_35870/g.110520 Transcript_35870/m.110520 type:complete len:136 (-) Transcript_35870:39-446(-)